MTTILVPTDFSENGKKALDFAVMFARQHKARLILLHVFELPYSPGAISFNVIHEELEQKASAALARMKTICGSIENSGNIVTEYHALEGIAPDTIAEYAKEHAVDIIVMGTGKNNGFGDVSFSSTTSDVLRKSGCPVFLVPPAWKGSDSLLKVAYATDFYQSDLDEITMLTSWLKPFNARLCLIHVNTDPETFTMDANKMSAFTAHVEKETGYSKLEFELLKGEEVEGKLSEYIKKQKPDLLVLSATRRGALGRILNASVTEHLAQISPVPLIAFHHPKKEKHLSI